VLSVAAFDGARWPRCAPRVIPEGADRGWLEGHVAREALRSAWAAGTPAGVRPAPRLGQQRRAPEIRLHPARGRTDPLWPDSARLALTGSPA
jgi:hypothetical protein